MAMARASAPSVPQFERVDGFRMDERFVPVQVPTKVRRGAPEVRATGRMFAFDARPEQPTYLIRGEVIVWMRTGARMVRRRHAP
jgi:hypothetical protein